MPIMPLTMTRVAADGSKVSVSSRQNVSIYNAAGAPKAENSIFTGQ